VTPRELVALVLLTVGVVLAAAAGYGFGGWPASCAVLAVLLLALGLALGYGEAPEQPVEVLEPDDDVDRADGGGQGGEQR
jgi:hypothetical protein